MKDYPHIVSQVYSGIWCILPETFQAIESTLRTHMNGYPGQVVALDAAKQEKKPMMRMNAGQGIGVLSVEGILGKRLSSLETLCGGVDVNDVVNAARTLAADPKVGTIVMDISSPGGVVTGIPEAYSALCQIAKDKTLIAYSDTQMCSAAMWLGAAAHSRYCARSADLGSIGVYTVQLDKSKQLENAGVNVQAVQAGKYKTAGAPWRPLTAEERALIQSRVDDVSKNFTDAMRAACPGVSDDTMQGQVFRGPRAVEAGLADGTYDSLDDLIAALLDTQR